MTRAAKVGLAVVLLAISAACLVGPSRFGRGSTRPECKRCIPPPPPDPNNDREIE